MSKVSLRSTTLLIFLLLSITSLKAQQIDILNSNNTASNVVSICQCDTLGLSPGTNPVRYFLGGNFSPATTFFYELASPNNNWSAADSLDLVELTQANNVTPVDTFSQGTKWAKLAIPCDAPLGPATLRIRNTNGEISDTIFYIINKIPDSVFIDTVIGGFPNPYTTVDDWGFCEGDSVALVVETQLGASYQWLLGGAPIPGETSDTMWVKTSGNYAVRVDLGACSRDSKDTLINAFLPQISINLTSSPPQAFQIDNPVPGNISPDDSVQFCATSTFSLRGNAPPTGSGLTFSYQWITDSLTQFGDRIYYITDSADTNQTVNIDSSNIEDPAEQRFYLVINDGFCQDTSEAYYVYMDTIPRTNIISRIYANGIAGAGAVRTDVCMKDSIILRGGHTGPNWEYQWQRYNTSTDLWQNLPNAANPNLEGDQRNLPVDTSIKPIAPLSFYRLNVTTVTPQGDAVCRFTTDSVRVRWFPEYDLDYRTDPWVIEVGEDSINFCETDSAQLIAPSTPNQLINNGLNYSYQWLRDSLDTALGTFVKVPVPNGAGRTVMVFETGRYYVALDDGICTDTSQVFRVFVDSLPRTNINPQPWPGEPSASLDLCLEDSVLLLADDIVLPGWEYQWQYNFGSGWSSEIGDTLPGISADTSYKPFGIDTVYFRLRIEYRNQFGNTICPFTTDSIRVVFYNPPNVSFIQGDTVQLCEGDSALVIAQGNALQYEWNGGVIRGPQAYFSDPGFHTVVATGVNGCTTSRDVFVELFDTQADAGPDIETTSGTIVGLSGSGGTNYRWSSNKPIAWSDFLSQNVQVSYDLPRGLSRDTVVIYLTVTNAEGCTDTDSLLLIVRDPQDDDLSLLSRAWNVFTPNDDGKNDVWDISGIVQEYGVCQLVVMNRWGSTVYEETDFDGVWEGNNNGGAPLPDGTYYYILACDDEVILKSAVTLIRNEQ